MSGIRAPLLERFERYYAPEPNSGCWLWTGSVHPSGYGQMWDGQKGGVRAHIVSYRLFKGEVPSGQMVRHKCDTPSCVNPDHLLTGTAQDNVDDAVSRNRHQKGSRHGAAKLNENQVRQILRDSRQSSSIAAAYGVSDITIRLILKRKKWRHVT